MSCKHAFCNARVPYIKHVLSLALLMLVKNAIFNGGSVGRAVLKHALPALSVGHDATYATDESADSNAHTTSQSSGRTEEDVKRHTHFIL